MIDYEVVFRTGLGLWQQQASGVVDRERFRTGDLVLADDPSDSIPPATAAVEAQVINRAQSWVTLGWDADADGSEDGNVQATTEIISRARRVLAPASLQGAQVGY